MQERLSDIDEKALWKILEVTRQISACTDLIEVVEAIIDAARDLLDADRGTVFLYDDEADELYTLVATGMEGVRFPAKLGIAGECARTREVVTVQDCYNDERFNPEIDRKTGYHTRCLLTIPLIGFDDSLVGVMQLLNKREGVFDPLDEMVGLGLAAQAAVAIQRARLIEMNLVKQKLERDLSLAREIQMGVLPTDLPECAGYEIAGWSEPAEQTGGDIFDVAGLDDQRVMLLLGDATGHGIAPALSVTQMRAMMRMGVRLRSDLGELFAEINKQLADDLPPNRFITAFLGELNITTHAITYHSGGQAPLLHWSRATERFAWLEATTPPLGIYGDIPIGPAEMCELEPGDVFALISDGIFEQTAGGSEQFGIRGVEQAWVESEDATADELLDRLRRAVTRFRGGTPRADDMTVLIVRRTD